MSPTIYHKYKYFHSAVQRADGNSFIFAVCRKLDDREAGDRFVKHEYDYRLNWVTRCIIKT